MLKHPLQMKALTKLNKLAPHLFPITKECK